MGSVDAAGPASVKLLDPGVIRPRRVYSQGSQDGIIESIFQEIGTTNRHCVEFGFNSKSLTDGSGSNTARLILEDGWTGLLLDSGYSNPAINLHRESLTPENFCEVFDRYRVPREADYVSIDVDSIDLWLFKAMLQGSFRPRLVSVEHNSNFRLSEAVTVRLGTKWAGDAVFGASLAALTLVAREFRYNLVAVDGVLDAFFVPAELCDPARMVPLERFAEFTGVRHHKRPPWAREKRLVKYPSLEPFTDMPWKDDSLKGATIVGPTISGAWEKG